MIILLDLLNDELPKLNSFLNMVFICSTDNIEGNHFSEVRGTYEMMKMDEIMNY